MPSLISLQPASEDQPRLLNDAPEHVIPEPIERRNHHPVPERPPREHDGPDQFDRHDPNEDPALAVVLFVIGRLGHQRISVNVQRTPVEIVIDTVPPPPVRYDPSSEGASATEHVPRITFTVEALPPMRTTKF